MPSSTSRALLSPRHQLPTCALVHWNLGRLRTFVGDEVGLKLCICPHCRSRFQGFRGASIAVLFARGLRVRVVGIEKGAAVWLGSNQKGHRIVRSCREKNMRHRIGRHNFADGVAHHISRFVRLLCFELNGRKDNRAKRHSDDAFWGLDRACQPRVL